jgi:hypothetical protein
MFSATRYRESRKGISEIEGKAVRVAASESGSRTSFNQRAFARLRLGQQQWTRIISRFAFVWVAHASRVLVAVSRRNELRKSKSGNQEIRNEENSVAVVPVHGLHSFLRFGYRPVG